MKRLGGLGWAGLVAIAACSGSPLRSDGGAAGASADGGAGTTNSAAGAGGMSGAAGMEGHAGSTGATFIFDPPTAKKVDVLFMIDDSFSMTLMQERLIKMFPQFVAALEVPSGTLPDLHLAIVSSSMGAGREVSISHCPMGGDQGTFRANPLGTTCAQGSLNAGQNFIAAGPGGNNFTGNLSDVFSCIAALGANGCGFEHQLASVLRALGADGAPAPPANANFLRANALLQVVLLTNEDDCSAPPSSDLFDTLSTSMFGPLESYRCNEYGHLCGGQPPPRTPATPTDLSGTCVSAEDGRLFRVKDVVTALKSLKADPSTVRVSVIGGPTTPYVVDTFNNASTGGSDWPEVKHSCMGTTDGSFADPGVRLHQLTDSFGANGSYDSICGDDLGLRTIAAKLAAAAADLPCLDAAFSPPQCTFVDHLSGGGAVPLPWCPTTNGVAPCWSLGAVACPNGQVVQFKRVPGAAPIVSTTATCTP